MNALAFVLYSFVGSALVALGATCVERCCDELRLQKRWIWVVAMGASVLIPLTSLIPRPAPLRATIDSAPSVHIVTSTVVARNVTPRTIVPTFAGSFVESEAHNATSVFARGAATLEPSLVVALWCSMLFLPLLLGTEWIRLRRARRTWREATMCGVAVLVSESFGPAVIGVVKPRIVIPSYVLSLPTSQQQLILAHEVEHLRAHDGRCSVAVLLLVALAPWNVFLWWQLARLRLAIELDCDARVLMREQSAHAYGTLLIDMASRSERASLFATAFLERYSSSLQRRIKQITRVHGRVNRARASLFAAMSVGVAPLIFVVPRPLMPPRAPIAAQSVADSAGLTIMYLNRAGRWVDAERVGLGLLSKRPASTGSGESCAVLIGVTYAEVLLQKRKEAAVSMSSFDASCSKAVYHDFFPGEARRVRRIVNGEAPNAVYGVRQASSDGRLSVATEVMFSNRDGHYDEAERIGQTFLTSVNTIRGDPEKCGVVIGVTYAQARLRHEADAKRSLARFDAECKGVQYLGWFPAEAERVRRMLSIP
ncbi:MAG: M56 family metallopeptidase [Gemmatimonadaceae bacterium]